MAQEVEHILGKDEVISSTLIISSILNRLTKPFVAVGRFYFCP